MSVNWPLVFWVSVLALYLPLWVWRRLEMRKRHREQLARRRKAQKESGDE